MAEKEKRTKTWSVDAFQVVACRNKKLAPFLNVFDFEGVSPQQKEKGRLFGVIQTFDYDEKSAYLPNLVAQVIKKEFFQENNRGLEESFEAALRRANLALADLASHEIVGWMGKFHAVIGALRENDFFFTQSGGGKIILVRKKIANQISDGLNSEENSSHPLKTFSNISSGRLEPDDKLIFATENIFLDKRWEEFSRHVSVFSSSELDNLLRSTVELEMQNDGFVLVNLCLGETALEKKELREEAAPAENLNFFGKQEKAPAQPEPAAVAAEATMAETSPATNEDSSPFEKEPELYIKENEEMEPVASEKTEELKIKPTEESPSFAVGYAPPQKNYWKKWLFWKHPEIKNRLAGLQQLPKKGRKKLDDVKTSLVRSASKEKIANFFQKKSPKEGLPEISSEASQSYPEREKFWKDFGRNLIAKLSPFKKTGLLVLIGVIFLSLTFLFVRGRKNFSDSTKPNPTTENNQSQNNDLENATASFKEIISLPDKPLLSTILRHDLYFITEKNDFYQLTNVDQRDPQLKKIDLPKEVSSIQSLAGMNDLNLVFIATQNDVFSFSPVTGKVLPNTIENLPPNKTASFTYLTYIYFLDPSSDQIKIGRASCRERV